VAAPATGHGARFVMPGSACFVIGINGNGFIHPFVERIRGVFATMRYIN